MRTSRDWWAIGAGIRSVALLFLTATDSLLTAAAGIPPIRWCARQLAAVIRDAYRVGRFGPPSESTEVVPYVVDGEPVEESSR
jgi:hypothetical protein